jgi:hypothetical protein
LRSSRGAPLEQGISSARYTQVGNDYLSHHSVVALSYPVQLELNNIGLGGRSAKIIEVGQCFGAVDQQPLVARVGLAVSDGTLVPVLSEDGKHFIGYRCDIVGGATGVADHGRVASVSTLATWPVLVAVASCGRCHC